MPVDISSAVRLVCLDNSVRRLQVKTILKYEGWIAVFFVVLARGRLCMFKFSTFGTFFVYVTKSVLDKGVLYLSYSVATFNYSSLCMINWYIALHSLDPRLVKMTVGCWISHTNSKTYTVQRKHNASGVNNWIYCSFNDSKHSPLPTLCFDD
jgi:hypothetical protein